MRALWPSTAVDTFLMGNSSAPDGFTAALERTDSSVLIGALTPRGHELAAASDLSPTESLNSIVHTGGNFNGKERMNKGGDGECTECGQAFRWTLHGDVWPGGKDQESINCPACGHNYGTVMTSGTVRVESV